MLNTSAPLFNKDFNSKELEKQAAELYCRLYAYGAEDFVAHTDMKDFVQLTVQCIEQMQNQLTKLMQVLSSHTHNVPPHTHPIEPHVHVCPATGLPGSPNVNALITMPTPLVTQMPIQSSSIRWTTVRAPMFKNSTGAPTNLEGNRVIPGVSKVGPLITGKRRQKTPTVLNSVSVLPIIKANNLLG